jgi:hypothetical protein
MSPEQVRPRARTEGWELLCSVVHVVVVAAVLLPRALVALGKGWWRTRGDGARGAGVTAGCRAET